MLIDQLKYRFGGLKEEVTHEDGRMTNAGSLTITKDYLVPA